LDTLLGSRFTRIKNGVAIEPVETYAVVALCNPIVQRVDVVDAYRSGFFAKCEVFDRLVDIDRAPS